MSSSPPKARGSVHDRLFRFSFSRVIHARGVLRALVGPELANRLDWSSLRLEPGSYVEEGLRGSMSDLLFSIRFIGSEQRALAYLLWEHMHGPVRLMPLRMVNYGDPTLRVYMDLEMIVHELHDGTLPAAELTTLARTTLRLLRLAALRHLVAANAERLARWLAQVHRAHGYDDFRALLEYIARAGNEDELMQAIIDHSDEELVPEAMSIADRLEARGEARGRVQGRAEMLLQQFEHRFGRLPPAVEARVLAATVEQLDRWALRLLDVDTLDEVWDDR